MDRECYKTWTGGRKGLIHFASLYPDRCRTPGGFFRPRISVSSDLIRTRFSIPHLLHETSGFADNSQDSAAVERHFALAVREDS